jgi:hypothetical protein
MTALRPRMLEDLRIRNYAPTTVSSYVRSVAEFAQHFSGPAQFNAFYPQCSGPDVASFHQS